jgi:predicted transcriptional regulator of viral defense system
MAQFITPISISRVLLQKGVFAFQSRIVADLFDLDKFQTSHLLQRMERDGLVARIEHGKFLLLGLSPEKVFANPLYIGCNLHSPSYVSFWSALHFYGLTEQVPLTVFLATTRRKSEREFRGTRFVFVTLKPEAFFGYRREVMDDLPVLVADTSKTILDCLSLPEYAGGITEVAKALRIAIAENSLDVAELIEYAGRLKNYSLNARLGYLLELLGQRTEGIETPRGPVRLDPGNHERGNYQPRWKLYVNIPPSELFPTGVA